MSHTHEQQPIKDDTFRLLQLSEGFGAARQRAPAWTLRRVRYVCCIILTTVTLGTLVSAPACKPNPAAGHKKDHTIENLYYYLRGDTYVKYGARITVGGAYGTTCAQPAGCWVPKR